MAIVDTGTPDELGTPALLAYSNRAVQVDFNNSIDYYITDIYGYLTTNDSASPGKLALKIYNGELAKYLSYNWIDIPGTPLLETPTAGWFGLSGLHIFVPAGHNCIVFDVRDSYDYNYTGTMPTIAPNPAREDYWNGSSWQPANFGVGAKIFGIEAVPEPATLSLIGVGLTIIRTSLLRRRKMNTF